MLIDFFRPRASRSGGRDLLNVVRQNSWAKTKAVLDKYTYQIRQEDFDFALQNALEKGHSAALKALALSPRMNNAPEALLSQVPRHKENHPAPAA